MPMHSWLPQALKIGHQSWGVPPSQECVLGLGLSSPISKLSPPAACRLCRGVGLGGRLLGLFCIQGCFVIGVSIWACGRIELAPGLNPGDHGICQFGKVGVNVAKAIPNLHAYTHVWYNHVLGERLREREEGVLQAVLHIVHARQELD